MIIVDYSATSIAAIVMAVKMQKEECSEEFCRHMILNSLRGYSSKFRGEYGNIVLAIDSRMNWRKDFYPEYKANRSKNREDSDIDWTMLFSVLNGMKDALREYFCWKVIEVEGAEADDVIGVLSKQADEKTLIVSNDKDFFQLHSDMVSQWRPSQGKIFNHPNPKEYLIDHIISGDKGDGVPNVFSDDRVLVEGTRQTILSKKRKSEAKKFFEKHGYDLGTEAQKENQFLARNIERNSIMIDLDNVPSFIQKEIIHNYKNFEIKGSQSTVMKWLAANRMRILLGNIRDFC